MPRNSRATFQTTGGASKWGAPADPGVPGTAPRSHNTTAAQSSREPSQTEEREAPVAFTFRPAPPTSGLPLPRVTGGMKNQGLRVKVGLEAREAGLVGNDQQT